MSGRWHPNEDRPFPWSAGTGFCCEIQQKAHHAESPENSGEIAFFDPQREQRADMRRAFV
jgi:hypothetical protein